MSLTLLLVVISHHVNHVLHILETLRFKVVQYLAYQLFLRPDEQHALPHHISRNKQLLELLYSETRVGRPLVLEIALLSLLRLLPL